MLPKIEYPKTEVSLLVTGKKVNIRPMTISEEKILLTAQESEDRSDIMRAIVQILEACVEGVKVKELPAYNIEWLFLKLRSQSVSNILKLNMVHEDKEYPFEVDLNKIEPTMPKEKQPPNFVNVNETITIRLKHPSISAVLQEDQNADQLLSNIIAYSIEEIEEKGKAFKPEINNDLIVWVNTIPSKSLTEIEKYINHVPTIEHEVKVDVGKDKPEIVRLTNVYDFFML